MKKKKLKQKIKQMQRDIVGLSRAVRMVSEDIGRHQCHCENYKAKTVSFTRFVPLPKIDSLREGYTGEIPIQKMTEVKNECTTGG